MAYGRNLHKSLQVIRGFAPAAKTSTVTGSGIDRRGFEEILVKQTVGAVSGTSPTLDGKIQDSADNSTFADVTGATFTQVTAADKEQCLRINGKGLRRYVRYVGTIAGTSPSFTMGVEFILGGARDLPTSLPSGHTAHVECDTASVTS